MSSPIGEASVEITADYSKFDRGLAAKLRSAANDAGRAVGDGIRDGVEDGTRTAYRDASGRLRDERGRFASAGQTAGRAAGNSIADGLKKALTPRLDNVLGALRGSLIARTVGLSLIGAAAAGATGPVLGLASALASTAGAAAIIPAAAGAAAAVIGTLRLATVGLEDAFSAVAEGDAQALAEALQRLAPSARALVLAVRDVKPAFDALQLGVQQRLFDGIAEAVAPLASTYLPGLASALGAIADAGNRTLRDLTGLFSTVEASQDVFRILGASGAAFDNLAASVRPLAQAFLDIAAVGSDFLGPITDGAAAAATAFRDWVAQARASGELTDIIQTALTALQQLGRVAGNVGGILRAVFTAAPDGGGILTTLETITGAVRDFLSSVQGQDALASFFASAGTALKAILPIVTTLAGGIGTVLAPAIAQIATILGPALQTVATALVAALGQIDIGPLAETLATVVTSIAPLLPVIGELANQLLTALVPAVQQMLPVWQQMIPVLMELLPPLVQLAIALLPIGVLLAQVATLGTVLLIPAIRALTPLVGVLATVWSTLTTPLLGVSAGFAQVQTAIAGLSFGPIIDWFTQLPELIGRIPALLSQLPDLIVSTLSALPTLLGTLFTNAIQNAATALGVGIGLIILTMTRVPGLVVGALQALPGLIAGAFRSVWAIARDVTIQGITTVINLVRSLPQRIMALGGAMLNAGRSLINAFMRGLRAIASGGVSGIASAIVGAIREWINRNVLSAIENGINNVLPGSPVRIPRLADGAYLKQPTVAMVAEAGPEVVIPLTRPQRAVRLARESGLVQLLQQQGAVQEPRPREQVPPAVVNVYSQASDPETVAYKVVGRLARLGMAV